MSAVGDFVGDLGEACSIMNVGQPYKQLGNALSANGIQSNEIAQDAMTLKSVTASKIGAPAPFI